MVNIIKLNKIKIYAYHGCLAQETVIGGFYEVNIQLKTNFIEAAKTDELSKTIDYVHVNTIVKEEMSKPSKLIEEVGYRIINRLKKEFYNLEKTTIEIIKLTPPINGDVESVSILIEE